METYFSYFLAGVIAVFLAVFFILAVLVIKCLNERNKTSKIPYQRFRFHKNLPFQRKNTDLKLPPLEGKVQLLSNRVTDYSSYENIHLLSRENYESIYNMCLDVMEGIPNISFYSRMFVDMRFNKPPLPFQFKNYTSLMKYVGFLNLDIADPRDLKEPDSQSNNFFDRITPEFEFGNHILNISPFEITSITCDKNRFRAVPEKAKAFKMHAFGSCHRAHPVQYRAARRNFSNYEDFAEHQLKRALIIFYLTYRATMHGPYCDCYVCVLFWALFRLYYCDLFEPINQRSVEIRNLLEKGWTADQILGLK